ncbi:MAG: tRNA lysidine(34) synthetase TilS [Thermomicrobiales bacterium]
MTAESGALQRVRRALERLRRSVGDGDETSIPVVVAALSGGADSLALVVLLRELDRLGELRLVAVHVDHGARPESAAEAIAVGEVVARLGVAFRSEVIAPDAIARHRGVGVEESMRRERYRLLAAVASQMGADVIATGHHRRDQAETVLLHLLRGAGLQGAGGMREIATVDVPWWTRDETRTSVRLWRPLLGEEPAMLRALVETHGLPVIDDPSNRSEVYRRNAVRHRVLPVLEDVVPGAEGNLAALAQRAADDNDALDGIALLGLREGEGRLARDMMMAHPVAIQRRMVRCWVAANAADVDLTFDRTEAVRLLLVRNDGGKVVEIGAGWRVRMSRGELGIVSPDGRDA